MHALVKSSVKPNYATILMEVPGSETASGRALHICRCEFGYLTLAIINPALRTQSARSLNSGVTAAATIQNQDMAMQLLEDLRKTEWPERALHHYQQKKQGVDYVQ